jgi:hypothetical protein
MGDKVSTSIILYYEYVAQIYPWNEYLLLRPSLEHLEHFIITLSSRVETVCSGIGEVLGLGRPIVHCL